MSDDGHSFDVRFDDNDEDEVPEVAATDFAPMLAELAGLGMEVARSVRALAAAQAELAQMAVAATRAAIAADEAPDLGEDGRDAAAAAAAVAADGAQARPGVSLALAALQRLSALGDMGLSFSRVSRSVRLTVAMDAQLKLGPQAFAPPKMRAGASAGASGPATAEAARAAAAKMVTPEAENLWTTVWRKAEIDLLVERAIETCAPESEHRRLVEEMSERLSDIDAEEGFLSRPFDEVVWGLCRDLGLDPDPAIWEEPDDDPPDPARSQRAIRQMRGPARPHWAPMRQHRMGFYPGSIWATVGPRLLQRRRELLARVAQAEASTAAVWTDRRATAQ